MNGDEEGSDLRGQQKHVFTCVYVCQRERERVYVRDRSFLPLFAHCLFSSLGKSATSSVRWTKSVSASVHTCNDRPGTRNTRRTRVQVSMNSAGTWCCRCKRCRRSCRSFYNGAGTHKWLMWQLKKSYWMCALLLMWRREYMIWRKSSGCWELFFFVCILRIFFLCFFIPISSLWYGNDYICLYIVHCSFES